ncbi:hypothetical protein, partial [Agrobacterium tumefaciens]|uniref:hypothetical protein n=1 Tax=Agrobacterium tumefaciens TaxID=358 RepID=UPI001AEE9436
MTVKVYSKGPKSLQTPQASPPTFLFLLIFNCQKTDRIRSHKIKAPKPKPRETNKHSAHQLDLFRTKDFVASSA